MARSSTRSSAGPSLGPGSGAAGHARPKAVLATASWTATERAPHQRLAQPEDAAARTAGGARRARSRTRSQTKCCAAVLQRPPISEPRTTSFCGPPLASSGYALRPAARHRQPPVLYGPPMIRSCSGFARAWATKQASWASAAQALHEHVLPSKHHDHDLLRLFRKQAS